MSSTEICDSMIASGSWNVPVVYDNFNFKETETILSIYFLHDNHDRWIWLLNRMKSGYWTAMESPGLFLSMNSSSLSSRVNRYGA